MTLGLQSASYDRHGAQSDPREHARAFDSLSSDVAALCRTVQGLLVHDHYGLHLYGDPPARLRTASRATLPVSERMDAILAAHNVPITLARPPFDRAVGTCRDFALMLCAMLRQRGVPARVRCGFARYFHPPSYEDHWICEYWKAEDRRWAVADAELDQAHREHLGIGFDPSDIPGDQFAFSWQAWQKYRADPGSGGQFGHGADSGPWFIHVNLARDLLALCKQEVSSWDAWRDAGCEDRRLSEEVVCLCDRLAELAAAAEGLSSPSLDDGEIAGFLARPSWRRA